MKQLFGVLVLVFGVLSGCMFFWAGLKLASASDEMSSIRSVGGNSVAEAYYQGAGEQGLAFSTALFAGGVGIIAISLGFSGHLLSSHVDTAKFSDGPDEVTSAESLSIVS